MRKFTFISVLFFISFYSQAQQLQLRPLVAFGASFAHSQGVSPFGYDNLHIKSEDQFKSSYAIGMGASYFSGPQWAFGLDLMYSQEGKDIHYTDTYDYNDKSTVHYLRLPVNISYYFRKPASKLRPYITAGISGGIVLRQTNRYEANNSYTQDFFSSIDYEILGFKATDVGLQLGVGCHYNINEKSGVFAELKAYNGIMEPYAPSWTGDVRNQNIRMQVGYSFCLK